MSEDETLCDAGGCPELRYGTSSEFCLNHQREIIAFQRWLDGADEGCWPAPPSFDFERSFWATGQRPV